MTPVKQTKLYGKDGIHNGNCLAACLASLLDLPLWMVPPFEDMFGRNEWRIRIDEWLSKMHGKKMVRYAEEPATDQPVIANGLSPRGVHHSVIWQAGGDDPRSAFQR